MESTTPPRLRRGGVVDEIEMSDGLSVHCVDTTDVVAVDTAHTKDVLSADATDFMSAHTTLTFVQWIILQNHGSSCRTMIHVREPAKPCIHHINGSIQAMEHVPASQRKSQKPGKH